MRPWVTCDVIVNVREHFETSIIAYCTQQWSSYVFIRSKTKYDSWLAGRVDFCWVSDKQTKRIISSFRILNIFQWCNWWKLVFLALYSRCKSEYTEKVHISNWNLLKILRLNWLQNFVIYCQHRNIYGNWWRNQWFTNS